jgi:hypothetical protein
LAKRVLTLANNPFTIWVLWELESGVVMDDSPSTPPDRHPGTDPTGITFAFSTTTKVWWSRPAGRTVTITMGPVGGQLSSGTLRVGNCLLLPGSWTEGFDALNSWLSTLPSLPWASARS